jgi:hypothetical protein
MGTTAGFSWNCRCLGTVRMYSLLHYYCHSSCFRQESIKLNVDPCQKHAGVTISMLR